MCRIVCEAVQRIIDSFSHSLICCESSAAIWLPGRLFQEVLNFSTLGLTRSPLSLTLTKHLLLTHRCARSLSASMSSSEDVLQNFLRHVASRIYINIYIYISVCENEILLSLSWTLALISVKYTNKKLFCTCLQQWNIYFHCQWMTSRFSFLSNCIFWY